MTESRIVRVPSEGILGGVCAGMAAYLRINPAFIRVLFILLITAGGVGTIAYLFLWLLLPVDSEQQDMAWDARLSQNAEELAGRMQKIGLEISRGFEGSHPQLPIYIGGTLVAIGIVFLSDTLNVPWLSWLRLEFLWASMLIAAGVILLVRRPKKD